MKKIEEHNHYPFNVVTKQDQRIIDIISNPEKSREEIINMSDKDLIDLLAIAGSKYKDNLVKLIFDIKKDNISDYLIMYLLENSYDMNQMIRYFVQFIPKERLNNIIDKTRLKISKIEENLRDYIRKILNESWGVGNTSEKERDEAFAKTNERVPYKKDLMIYAIKGGFEIGLLFKTKNEKDKMPIAKYRTVLPMAIGTHKSSGNEVVSAFHEIGQSESKARLTGKRSAEARNEWRLFNTKNILSMWLTGKTFDKAPKGFKGSSDSRMSTVEVYFKPDEAKKVQMQQSAEKEKMSGERNKLIQKGMPKPEEEPVQNKKTNKKPEIQPEEKPKNIPIKSVAPKHQEENPIEKTKPVLNKKEEPKKEEPKITNNIPKSPIKPIGYKDNKKNINQKDMNKKIKLKEIRQIIRNLLIESENIHYGDYGFTIEEPIIGDAIKALEKTPGVVKFDNKEQFDEFLKKQKYFSASHSHCFYSPEDQELSYKGDARFREGNSGVSESNRGCVLLFNTGHNLVAAWDESQKIGYILPGDVVRERNR